MAIELNVGSVRTALTTETNLTEDLGVAQKGTLTPVLSGDSLKVTSGAMSDLEKLVARLKNEDENVRQSVSQRRVAILQTVLDSLADRISAADKAKILELEELNGQKTAAAGLNVDKAATEGRISAIDLEIAALESAVEREVQNGADHREKIAKLKQQRNLEQAKLDQINSAIKSTSAKIADLDVKIAKCIASIGSTTLSEVSSALREAASQEKGVVEPPESEADRTKEAEKAFATDISRLIRESLDKIDSQIKKALAEAQEVVKA